MRAIYLENGGSNLKWFELRSKMRAIPPLRMADLM
jgi:hypothetical protein